MSAPAATDDPALVCKHVARIANVRAPFAGLHGRAASEGWRRRYKTATADISQAVLSHSLEHARIPPTA